MSVKYSDSFVLNCIKLNSEGRTLSDIAKAFGIKGETLAKRAKALGYAFIDHRVKNIPQDELIELFINGMSVKALAEKFGVSRSVITNRLIKNGIKPRNRSESMFNRMAHASVEERKNITHKANLATRGKSANRKRLVKGAITRVNKPKFIGFGEEELKNSLIKIGFDVVSQLAFDIYNIDLVVNGNIAVEVKIGCTNPLRIKKHVVKTEKLINSGYGVVWICATSRESFIANLGNFISFLNVFCSNPSSIGKYRVISGYFDCSFRKNNLGQFTSEISSKNPKIREWT